jgi:hypothetical protein
LPHNHAFLEHLRTCCDTNNLFFLIDEYTDVESGPAVREMTDAVLDALNNPYKARPQGETIIAEVTRQYVVNLWGSGTLIIYVNAPVF